MNRVASITLGDGTCPNCGAAVLVKTSKRGLPYINCEHPPEGCGSQILARSDVSAQKLIERITKWRDGAKAKLESQSGAEPPVKPRRTPSAPPRRSPASAKPPARSPASPSPSPSPAKPKSLGLGWMDTED